MKFLRKFERELLILNGIAVLWYAVAFQTFPQEVSDNVMFSSVDAGTYKDVGNWIFGGEATPFSAIRPFGYSVFVHVVHGIGGAVMLWLVQSIMWLLTINFIFLAARQLSNNRYLSWISALLVLMNVSLMALTVHAITEVMSAMMLAMLVWITVKYYPQRHQLKFIHAVLFCLAWMVVVKPVFTIPLYLVLVIILPLFYRKLYFRKPVKLMWLPLVLLPFLIQIGIMKTHHDTFKVSQISENTFTAYFLAQGIQQIEQTEWGPAQQKALSLSKAEQKGYLLEHVGYYISNFVKNVQDNIKGAPIFLTYPLPYESKAFGPFMEALNKIVLVLHYVMLAVIILLIFLMAKKRNWNELTLLLTLSGLTAYYLLSTGISFWQGDRLVISVLPVWAVLYPWVIMLGFRQVRGRK